jgi:hypothetical protein
MTLFVFVCFRILFVAVLVLFAYLICCLLSLALSTNFHFFQDFICCDFDFI